MNKIKKRRDHVGISQKWQQLKDKKEIRNGNNRNIEAMSVLMCSDYF
jgi:hypothetical protein